MRLWPLDHRPPYRASGPELTSLAERYGALLTVRAAITATVALAAALFPGQVGITVAGVGPITLAYLLTGALTEWARRAAQACEASPSTTSCCWSTPCTWR